MKFAAALIALVGVNAVQVNQQSSNQMTAQAFSQQLAQLNTRVAENQKSLEEMKGIWDSIKGLF